MRDKWYADNRDLIKWSGIIHLCLTRRIKTAIQIPYYRSEEWPAMVFDDEEIPLSPPVIEHFRDIRDIKRLSERIDLEIVVFQEYFDPSHRVKYHNDVCAKLHGIKGKKVVFVDPDKGLAIQKYAAEHVKPNEVREIWRSLNLGDILVFYQHRFRNKDWLKLRRNQLSDICGVEVSRVRTWLAQQIAHDVAFYYIEK